MSFKTLIFYLFLIAVNGQSDEEICPKKEDIAPCSCDREGFSCLKAKNEEDIRRAFSAPSKIKATRAFWLNGSPVKEIRNGTFNGYKISSFNMEYNRLETIESGAFAGSEKTMRTLSVDSNRIKTLSFAELAKFRQLSTLSVRNNSIKEIPENAFKDYEQLSVVSFALNDIKKIGKQAFAGLNLKTLDLTVNDIEELGEESLSSLKADQLILIYSGIKRISKSAFNDSKFIHIDLRHNHLTYLDKNVFQPLMIPENNPKILITTGGNEFSCNGCNEYKWLVERKNVLRNVFIDFRCKDRRRLSDLTLYSIGC